MIIFTGIAFTALSQKPAYEVHLLTTEDGLSSNWSHLVFTDSKGYAWMPSRAGLNRYDGKQFKVFKNSADSTTIGGDFPKSIVEDKDGNLWMTIESAGLNRFDPKTETFTRYKLPVTETNKLSGESPASLDIDDSGILWIGRQEGSGFFKFDPTTEVFTHITLPEEHSEERVLRLAIDPYNKDWLWIMRAWSQWRYHKKEGFFESVEVPYYRSQIIGYIENDSTYWMGGWGTGLRRFNPLRNEWKGFIDPKTHPYIKMVNKKTQFTHSDYIARDLTYRKRNYAPPFVISIIPLGDDKLLLGCYSRDGIHVFDKKTETFSRFIDDKSLVQTDAFLRGTHLREDDYGRIWFGAEEIRFDKADGIYLLDPVVPKKLKTSIVLTDLLVNNKPFESDTNINYLHEIVLQSHENVIDIGFALLNYSVPDSNHYEYMLEGEDSAWLPTNQENNRAFYKGLSPGYYNFKVKGAHPKGFYSNELVIPIRIIPEWYQTLWARLLFFVLMAGSLWTLYNTQIKRIQQKNKLAKERAEAERIRQLDEAKSQLYTNITHEFRTPISVILGLTEQLQTDPATNLKPYLNTIHKNGNELFDLVNQLLDLSKIEVNALKLDYIQGDIMKYLHYLVESYMSTAILQKKSLAFFSEPEDFVMDFDVEKLRRIIGNLMSNALKFTSDQASIKVSAIAKSEVLELKISDTGEGIAAEHLPHVFDRFYQVDDSSVRRSGGTGIGLALVKELVVLLGGTIEVESEVMRGTTFKITLPVRQQAILQEPAMPLARSLPSTNIPAQLVAPVLEGHQRPQLLIIEDHPDVVEYLKVCLQEYYIIQVARNGEEGLKIAKEQIPDIIISDVMMPKMDGFEVCAQLKTNSRTSHIPILLLTAKATLEDRIEGLSQGADAYLTKPFNKQELLIRMKQLITLRQQLQTRYSGIQFLNDMDLKSDEKDFLGNLASIIHIHIADEGFQITHLCRAAGMSRTQLHRKVKGLTGDSTSVFVRQIKMDYAKKLLKTSDKSISEVAYSIGYKYPNHFSTDFKNHFGYSPNETRN